MEYKTKKLLKGITLFSAFYISNHFIGGADGLYQIEKQVYVFLLSLPEALAHMIASIVVLIFAIAMLYCFVSGLFRICTYHIYLQEYENNI